MLPFLHHRLGHIADLLEKSNSALRAHQDADLDAPDRIDDFLASMATTYSDLGLEVGANEALALRAQHTSARRGYPPGAISKAPTDRRGLERAVGLMVLSTSADRLRADFSRYRTSLEEGRDQLRVLLLHGLRIGVVPLSTEAAPNAEAAWKALVAEPDVRPLAQQAAMQMSMPDIHLLLVELISLIAVS